MHEDNICMWILEEGEDCGGGGRQLEGGLLVGGAAGRRATCGRGCRREGYLWEGLQEGGLLVGGAAGGRATCGRGCRREGCLLEGLQEGEAN